MPRVRFAVGCHPHNAKFYDDDLERALLDRLADPRVSAVGEIGLDYHYDFSPREDQREAFRRQIRVAKQAGLPVVLHIREAHDEAFAILQEEGFPEIAHIFTMIAGIEKLHGDRFGQFAQLLEQDRLFVSDVEVKWMCLNCGQVVDATMAPALCPVCKHPQGYFIRWEMAPFS